MKLWVIACNNCSSFRPYPGPHLAPEVPKAILWCPSCKCEMKRVCIAATEEKELKSANM